MRNIPARIMHAGTQITRDILMSKIICTPPPPSLKLDYGNISRLVYWSFGQKLNQNS